MKLAFLLNNNLIFLAALKVVVSQCTRSLLVMFVIRSFDCSKINFPSGKEAALFLCHISGDSITVAMLQRQHLCPNTAQPKNPKTPPWLLLGLFVL